MAKFRLATLLKLRERDRDVAAKAVQDVRLAIEKLHERQREIDESNRSMDAYRKHSSNGTIHLHQILNAQRFQTVLAAESAQIADQQGTLRQELEQHKIALLQCQQAVKSLEKLKEKRDDTAQTLALGKEQERLDEWSSIQHAMNPQPHGNDQER